MDYILTMKMWSECKYSLFVLYSYFVQLGGQRFLHTYIYTACRCAEIFVYQFGLIGVSSILPRPSRVELWLFCTIYIVQLKIKTGS